MEDQLRNQTKAHLADLLISLNPEVQDELLEQISGLLEVAANEERERCVNVCRHRAETWRQTSAAKSALAEARDEARARANEAEYLADLIETQPDEYPDSDA